MVSNKHKLKSISYPSCREHVQLTFLGYFMRSVSLGRRISQYCTKEMPLPLLFYFIISRPLAAFDNKKD